MSEFEQAFLKDILASSMLFHHLKCGRDVTIVAPYKPRQDDGYIEAGFKVDSIIGGIVQRSIGGQVEWHT